MYAVTWLVHAIVTSYLSNGWIRIARLLFVWQIGVMPVFVTEYSVSDEVNFSGGATIACGLGLAAYALVQYASLTIDSQNNSNRITPERSGIRATSLHDLFHTISINASAIRNCSVPVALFWSGITFFTYSYNTGRHTDFCPALSATDNAGLVAYCIGHEALGLLTVVLCVLPLFSLLSAIRAITLAARNANNGGNAANADGSRNSAAVCYLLLATALSATAFVIAFTLA